MGKTARAGAPLILAINPGSTSTKVALFRGPRRVAEEAVRHSAASLRRFRRIVDQAPLRERAVRAMLNRHRIRPGSLAAVVGRGGLLAPCPSGTYRVGPEMLEDLAAERYGAHASNLGAILADRITSAVGVPAFVVDPVVVDELCPEARLSGMPEIPRRSVWHALNHKRVARRVAGRIGRRYEDANLVVAHLGGGVSVAAHRRGRAVEVNNALDGEGPFAVERSGAVPAADLLDLAERRPGRQLRRRIAGAGGVAAYLRTNDLREVERRVAAGDATAQAVLSAMGYQIAREIGACAATLAGRVDAVVLAGGAARCRRLTARIRRRVTFIAPVYTVPGEMEMEALADGALRVLSGEARARSYPPRRRS